MSVHKLYVVPTEMNEDRKEQITALYRTSHSLHLHSNIIRSLNGELSISDDLFML